MPVFHYHLKISAVCLCTSDQMPWIQKPGPRDLICLPWSTLSLAPLMLTSLGLTCHAFVFCLFPRYPLTKMLAYLHGWGKVVNAYFLPWSSSSSREDWVLIRIPWVFRNTLLPFVFCSHLSKFWGVPPFSDVPEYPGTGAGLGKILSISFWLFITIGKFMNASCKWAGSSTLLIWSLIWKLNSSTVISIPEWKQEIIMETKNGHVLDFLEKKVQYNFFISCEIFQMFLSLTVHKVTWNSNRRPHLPT